MEILIRKTVFTGFEDRFSFAPCLFVKPNSAHERSLYPSPVCEQLGGMTRAVPLAPLLEYREIHAGNP
jgi:hypothetical protein